MLLTNRTAVSWGWLAAGTPHIGTEFTTENPTERAGHQQHRGAGRMCLIAPCSLHSPQSLSDFNRFVVVSDPA